MRASARTKEGKERGMVKASVGGKGSLGRKFLPRNESLSRAPNRRTQGTRVRGGDGD